MEQNWREEKAADYQVYTSEGSHEEIGRSTALRGKFAIHPQEEWNAEQKAYALKCRDVVQDIYPEIIEEFEGYAKALQLSEDQCLWHFTLGVQGGCSAIALRTGEGMLVGRNYDYYYFENRRHLIHTKPNIGLSHIGMHEGLIGGRFDGLNEKGLFVSFNGAGPHPDPAPPGMAFHLIVRYLLETCSSAVEALEKLMKLPVKEPKSYLLADSNTSFAAEIHIDRREYREMADDDILVVTNHFVHPEMRPYQPEWPNSVNRFRRLSEQGTGLLTAANPPVQALQSLMADHEAPVCGHTEGLATFWSCTALPGKRQIQYSLGAPCRNEYTSPFDKSLA